MNLKNYEKTLTVKGFDVRIKRGRVHLNDVKKLAYHLNYDVSDKTPKNFLKSEYGSKVLELAGENSVKSNFAKQEVALKYAEQIGFILFFELDYALGEYNSSMCSRNMARESQTSMREALWASGGDWPDIIVEFDLITSIVLGCTASEFIENNNLPEDESYTAYLTDTQTAAIDCLTRLNTIMIEEGVSILKRREKLEAKFDTKYAAKIKVETDNLLLSM